MPNPYTNPYSEVFAYINNACNGYIGQNVQAVAHAIEPAATALLGVYIILWALAHLSGKVQEPLMDAAFRVLKIAVIFGIAIQLGSYNSYVVDTFYNAPEQLAKALTHSTDNQSAIHVLDQILFDGFMTGKAFWDKGSLLKLNLGMYLFAILVWATVICVTAYACFLIVLAKIALSIIISLGPLFIIGLLFQSTQRFFDAWIAQLSNYFMVIVLVAATNVFVMDLFKGAVSGTAELGGLIQIDKTIPFFLMSYLCFRVLDQIPHLAAGLAGGFSLSAYGLGGSFGLGRLALSPGKYLTHRVQERLQERRRDIRGWERHAKWADKRYGEQYRDRPRITHYRRAA